MSSRTVRRWVSVSLVALLAAASAAAARAEVPGTLTHQGRLYDAKQQPVEGPLEVEVALYDKEDAATPIWSEVHQVTFESGYFSIQLGSIAPFSQAVFDGSVR